MYQLCMACWRSRSESNFNKTSKGNLCKICKECYLDGQRDPEFEFKKSQSQLEITQQLKFCNSCYELKIRLEFYPKSGSAKKYGKDPRSNICIDCDIKNQKSRKDPRDKRLYDNQDGL